MTIAFVMLLCTACSQDKRVGSSAGSSAAASANPPSDSLYTAEYINKICRTKPQEALTLLDEAEKTHKMRTVKINVLRTMIYVNAYYDTKKGMEYAMKAYNDPSIKNDTLPRITVTRVLTALNYAISRFAQACTMATEGSELAHAVGDDEALAYFYQFIAFTKYELGDHEESYRYFDRSITLYRDIIDKTPHWVYVSDMLFLMLQEMKYLNGEGRYREALAKTAACEETISRLASFPDIAEGLLDKTTAQYLSMACCVFYNAGSKARAEAAYRKMLATDYVKSDMGQNVPALYEVLCGRYKEALERTVKEEELYRNRDTLNTVYIDEVLCNGLEACQGLGDYKRANSYFRRILSIKDSINLRNQKQAAMELSEIYESRDKDIQLIEKDALLLHNRIFLGVSFVIIAIAIGVIVAGIRYNRIIQRKNKAVVLNIEEKLQLMQLAEKGRADNPQDQAEHELFEYIDKTIREQQLYLQSDFSRDALCQMMNINKTQCSTLFKKYAQCTFPSYLNRLRLNHAVVMMKEHPDYSMEAIANECGLERVTFHRRFVEQFGITPAEFKKTKL